MNDLWIAEAKKNFLLAVLLSKLGKPRLQQQPSFLWATRVLLGKLLAF